MASRVRECLELGHVRVDAYNLANPGPLEGLGPLATRGVGSRCRRHSPGYVIGARGIAEYGVRMDPSPSGVGVPIDSMRQATTRDDRSQYIPSYDIDHVDG
jgi:hypothetical protein